MSIVAEVKEQTYLQKLAADLHEVADRMLAMDEHLAGGGVNLRFSLSSYLRYSDKKEQKAFAQAFVRAFAPCEKSEGHDEESLKLSYRAGVLVTCIGSNQDVSPKIK